MKHIIIYASLLWTTQAIAHPGHHEVQNTGSFFQVLGQWLSHSLHSEYHLFEWGFALLVSLIAWAVYRGFKRLAIQRVSPTKVAK